MAPSLFRRDDDDVSKRVLMVARLLAIHVVDYGNPCGQLTAFFIKTSCGHVGFERREVSEKNFSELFELVKVRWMMTQQTAASCTFNVESGVN